MKYILIFQMINGMILQMIFPFRYITTKQIIKKEACCSLHLSLIHIFPMKLLEEGKSRDEIYTYMKQTYFASDEKICLATDIAERELSLLSKIDYDNGYSLYIGIPFCPTTCLYCSFTSYPIASWAKRVDSYLDALEREIEFAAVKFAGRHLNSCLLYTSRCV